MDSRDIKSELSRVSSSKSCDTGFHVGASPMPSSASVAGMASNVSVQSLGASSEDEGNVEGENEGESEKESLFADDKSDKEEYFLFWN